MSSYQSHAINCDGCGENSENWIGVAYLGDPNATLAKMRRLLREQGWQTSRAGDFCPNCVTDRRIRQIAPT